MWPRFVHFLFLQGERGLRASRGAGTPHRFTRRGRYLLWKLQNHPGLEICKGFAPTSLSSCMSWGTILRPPLRSRDSWLWALAGFQKDKSCVAAGWNSEVALIKHLLVGFRHADWAASGPRAFMIITVHACWLHSQSGTAESMQWLNVRPFSNGSPR